MQADSQQQHVKDLGVVLGAEAAAIIVDDTASVWPQHAANLLLARPCRRLLWYILLWAPCRQAMGSRQGGHLSAMHFNEGTV